MKLLELYQNKIMGAISGLDRIRFRGTLRWLANGTGIGRFLCSQGILLKDFTGWAKDITQNIRDRCNRQAGRLGIETIYLNRSGIDKEKYAREIARRNGIDRGPICNFSVLETCCAPRVKGNRASKHLEIRFLPTKCIHVYHYFDHPDYGFGHVRLQTWAPYTIFICLNGRHWLERQLQKEGIAYLKDGNCFPWLEELESPQRMLDQQLSGNWDKVLCGLVKQMCPDLRRAMRPARPDYYWSAEETEWATDIMFKSAGALDSIYSELLYHGIKISDSSSVMRFLGRRGGGLLPEEVISDYRRRYEGIRIKHGKNQNSVKMYNKSGSILRIETTINNTRDFKVYRHPEDDKNRPASWQKMRKGVSDLHRRCVVSQQCNERYGDALSSAQVEEKLKEVVSPVCNQIKKDGKRYRGLNVWQQEDYTLLLFLAKGENGISGFRNKDLRQWLYPQSAGQRKYSSRTGRLIKLLRIHGLVKKVAGENRYMLTAKGQKFATVLKTASAVDIKALTNIAA